MAKRQTTVGGRIATLDVLRVGALCLLFVAHIGQEIHHPLGKFFGYKGFYHSSLGGVAVTIFLALSGAALYLSSGGRRLPTADFLTKRLLRIYPVYWMSLVVAISATLLRSWLRTGQLFGAFPKLHAADITLSLTGTYAYVGRWGGPFNGVTWFVGLILSMYLLYPLLAWMFRRHPHLAILSLAAVSGGVRFLVGKYALLSMRPLDWFPLCRVFEFAVGMYLVVLWRRVPWRPPRVPRRLGQLLSFLGKLTFPLFLVHYPLIFLIRHFKKSGFSQGDSILIFLGISLALALLMQLLDDRIPRRHILRRLGVGARRTLSRVGVVRRTPGPHPEEAGDVTVRLDADHAALRQELEGASWLWLVVFREDDRANPVGLVHAEVRSLGASEVILGGVELPDGTPVLAMQPDRASSNG